MHVIFETSNFGIVNKKMKNMKNLIFASLMMLGVFLPTNIKADTTSDSLSILDKLYFHLNDDDDDAIMVIL